MHDVRVFPEHQAFVEAAARHITDRVGSALDERGICHLVLSGGSTPVPVYELLARPPYRDRIDWSRVHVYWGDERHVAPDHPSSNYRMAQEALLAHVAIPQANVYRIPAELPPDEAAAIYQATVREILGPDPRFDLILLGMGTDGHTASLFPGDPALDVEGAAVVPVYRTDLELPWRVTLTLPVLNAARAVLFLVSGEEKAEAISRIWQGESLPAGRVQPRDGEVTWMLGKVE